MRRPVWSTSDRMLLLFAVCLVSMMLVGGATFCKVLVVQIKLELFNLSLLTLCYNFFRSDDVSIVQVGFAVAYLFDAFELYEAVISSFNTKI